MVIVSFLLLTIRNVSDKSYRKNTSTRFICSTCFSENCGVYEIKWENTEEPDRPRMTIWRMSIACWTPKAKNTHSEYITIIAFLRHNGCTKAPQWYVIRTLPLFLMDTFILRYYLTPNPPFVFHNTIQLLV